MKNRKPFYLQVPDLALVYAPLTMVQFSLGMIEHYGDEITLQRGAGKYVVRHNGEAMRRLTSLRRARGFAAKFTPALEEFPRKHGVAPLGANDLQSAGWRPLGK